jgi:hypothetical protein
MTKDKIFLGRFISRREVMDKYIHIKVIPNTFTCPSCAFPTLSQRINYEICPICNWEDDGQDDLDADNLLGGPNGNLSLTDSRLKINQEIEAVESKTHLKVTEDPERILEKTTLLFLVYQNTS